MNSSNKHIIEKVRFRINTASLEEAHHLKATISDVLHSIFLPYLERYFNEMYSNWNDPIIRVEQLKISLDLNDLKSEFSEVTAAFRKEMDRTIQEAMHAVHEAAEDTPVAEDSQPEKTGKSNVIQPEQRKQEALFHFLKTGRVPWWITPKQLDELLDEEQLMIFLNTRNNTSGNSIISSSNSSWHEFVRLIKTNVTVRTRFAAQFSSSFVLGVLMKLSGVHTSIQLVERSFFTSFYSPLNSKKREQFLALILDLSDDIPTTPTQQTEWKNRLQSFAEEVYRTGKKQFLTVDLIREFNQIIACIIPTNELELSTTIELEKVQGTDDELLKKQETAADAVIREAEKILKEQEEKEEDSELLEKGMFVENAGLIILHPFLSHFFQQVGLLDEHKQLNDPDLAIHVLHYLATGLENDWEHNLVFEKFLCGIPLSKPVNKPGALSLEMKAEAEELFRSLLEHWSVLKNSSAELIRHEFLTRNGKLFQDSVSARLIVERKTQDILLDKLPWGISIAKFPWSTNILYSTW